VFFFINPLAIIKILKINMFFNKKTKELVASQEISLQAKEAFEFFRNTKFFNIEGSGLNTGDYSTNEYVVKFIFFYMVYHYRIRTSSTFDGSIVTKTLSLTHPEFDIQKFAALKLKPNNSKILSNLVLHLIEILDVKKSDHFSIGLLCATESYIKREVLTADNNPTNYHHYFSSSNTTHISLPDINKLSQDDLLTTTSFLLFFFCIIYYTLRLAKISTSYDDIELWGFLNCYSSGSYEEIDFYSKLLVKTPPNKYKSKDPVTLRYMEEDLLFSAKLIMDTVNLIR